MVKINFQDLHNLCQYVYEGVTLDQKRIDLLHNAGLIVFDDNGKVRITSKGTELVNSDMYIAPEGKSNTSTLSFDSFVREIALNKQAMTNLGYSLLNNHALKRWSKEVNYEFAKDVESTLDYYTNKDHPTTRIRKYREAVNNCSNKLETVIKDEFDKITDFVLAKKMYLQTNKNGDKVYLLEIINKNLYRVQIGNNKELSSVQIPADELYIVANHKEDIVRLYYTHKSTNKHG